MASNETLIVNPDSSCLVFADHDTDFTGGAPATAAESLIPAGLTITQVQIDLTTRATDEAVESDKADFGATRSPIYRVDAAIEFVSTFPIDGEIVEFYWGPSHASVAANGNPAGLVGVADTDAQEYSDTAGLLAQLDYIGSLTLSNEAIVSGKVGFLVPSKRYGGLIVINKSTIGTNSAAGMDETHIVFTPMTYGT